MWLKMFGTKVRPLLWGPLQVVRLAAEKHKYISSWHFDEGGDHVKADRDVHEAYRAFQMTVL
jgi:hypothetical protein